MLGKTDVSRYRESLLGLYAALDEAVAERAPVCRLSGRCCRFAEYGHTLFVSAAEAALLVADAPAPARALDDGESCPWQDAAGRCTARNARPLGCRVYFCDPAFEPHAPELSEEYIGHLKRLTEKFDLPWDYVPLHQHLQRARDEGQFPACETPDQ